ncbi:MAG: HAMP domain-containing sensor histidine kinase [Lysinibacillus sp.]
MKIKTWLLITYLLVMLLPLVALYGLYVSINNYYQDKSMQEYFEKLNDVNALKSHLENPKLYTDKQFSEEKVEGLTNEQTMITLYHPSGRGIYSSNPLATYTNFEDKEVLYKELYEFKQNYETFVYKQPVYEEGKIVGIFKITLARTEWTEQVGNNTKLIVASLIGFLLLLYGVIVYFLNRRLNQPLKQLIQQMQAFAKGKPTKPLPIQKDEIGDLTASFQRMQQEIMTNREKIESEQRQKEFMIASLSHDLKTPLTSIQAYAESLQSNALSEHEKQEYLQIVQSKSDYMKQLLDDLMMFTLLQSPTYELELVSVEGDEFFEMLLGDYEQVSVEKGFTATTHLHVTNSYAVNPKQLMRVLDNLVGNAWTYTNPGGTIRVAAFEAPFSPSWYIASAQKVKGRGVYIVVQNSGSTLSNEQCQRMFEPMHQLDEARSHMGQRGAGLGLSIAKQIIEKHNGTIQAISYENETAITIWLPEEEKL